MAGDGLLTPSVPVSAIPVPTSAAHVWAKHRISIKLDRATTGAYKSH